MVGECRLRRKGVAEMPTKGSRRLLKQSRPVDSSVFVQQFLCMNKGRCLGKVHQAGFLTSLTDSVYSCLQSPLSLSVFLIMSLALNCLLLSLQRPKGLCLLDRSRDEK